MAAAFVPAHLRRQGIATALYFRALEEAERRRATLRPGITINPAVLRIHEKVFRPAG